MLTNQTLNPWQTQICKKVEISGDLVVLRLSEGMGFSCCIQKKRRRKNTQHIQPFNHKSNVYKTAKLYLTFDFNFF